MATHLALIKAIRMRVCHYCTAPIDTAFYVQPLHAWACVPCYIEHVVRPAANTTTTQSGDASEAQCGTSQSRELASVA